MAPSDAKAAGLAAPVTVPGDGVIRGLSAGTLER